VLAAHEDDHSNGKVGAVGGSAGATHAVWVAATGITGQDRWMPRSGFLARMTFLVSETIPV